MERTEAEKTKAYVEYKTVTHEQKTPTQPYGEWYRNSETTPLRVSNKKPKSSLYEEFAIDFRPGHKVFLVWGVYSEGDSFGHEEGCASLIELFKTIDEAEAFAARVEGHNKLERDNFWNMTPKQKAEAKEGIKKSLEGYYVETPDRYRKGILTDGKGKEYHFPWGGYFENLTEVKVEILDYVEYQNKER